MSLSDNEIQTLVERLEKRAADYRQSGPSAEHSAALYDEAAAYIRSQSSIIASQAEKLSRTERNRDMWKGQVERQAATIASAREVIEQLLPAAEKVLEGLHARIDAAENSAVPVFYGISDLHDAIGATREWKGR